MKVNAKKLLNSIVRPEIEFHKDAPINKQLNVVGIKFPINSFIKGVKIESPIQINDDNWMVQNNYRKTLIKKDTAVFFKTAEEKLNVKAIVKQWNKTHRGYKVQTIKLS